MSVDHGEDGENTALPSNLEGLLGQFARKPVLAQYFERLVGILGEPRANGLPDYIDETNAPLVTPFHMRVDSPADFALRFVELDRVLPAELGHPDGTVDDVIPAPALPISQVGMMPMMALTCCS